MNPSTVRILIAIAIMAGVTYLTRVIPLALVQKKIKNIYIQSFLIYMPYGVLASMTIPDVFYSTANLVSAIAGLLVALLLGFLRKGLLTVALSAIATVFIVEQLMVWLLPA